MYLRVSGDLAELVDAATVTELVVRAEGVSAERVRDAMSGGGWGVFDGDHVWLGIDRLRREALDAGLDAAAFDGMIAFARKKGWCSDDAASVRAHVEYG